MKLLGEVENKVMLGQREGLEKGEEREKLRGRR